MSSSYSKILQASLDASSPVSLSYTQTVLYTTWPSSPTVHFFPNENAGFSGSLAQPWIAIANPSIVIPNIKFFIL